MTSSHVTYILDETTGPKAEIFINNAKKSNVNGWTWFSHVEVLAEDIASANACAYMNRENIQDRWRRSCAVGVLPIILRVWCPVSEEPDKLFLPWYIYIWTVLLPSVLWRCWLGGRKGIRPVKNLSGGILTWLCLGQGADLHTVQLMPLPLTISCSSKSRLGFTLLVLPFWYRLTRVVRTKSKRAIKR